MGLPSHTFQQSIFLWYVISGALKRHPDLSKRCPTLDMGPIYSTHVVLLFVRFLIRNCWDHKFSDLLKSKPVQLIFLQLSRLSVRQSMHNRSPKGA